MTPGSSSLFLVAVLSLSGPSCTTQSQVRTNALEYLYPKGTEAVPATDVKLKVPVRVGVMFPPSSNSRSLNRGGVVSPWNVSAGVDPISEFQKQALLTQLVNAFRNREGVGLVQIIPTNYLSPGGSFPDLERAAGAFGFDLVALISYDQFQFSESARTSLAYLTIVGAYFIQAEKNETRTLMDAVVFDVASRSMLFRAAGQSSVKASSTPIDMQTVLRQKSEEGFESAMKDLIGNLDVAVTAFAEQVKAGTVRGPGTPRIERTELYAGSASPGTRGAGALGMPELAAACLLVALGFVRRKDRGTRA